MHAPLAISNLKQLYVIYPKICVSMFHSDIFGIIKYITIVIAVQCQHLQLLQYIF